MNKIAAALLFSLLALPQAALAADEAKPKPTDAEQVKEAVYRANLGRADDVKLLIDQGVSANATDGSGTPLLSLAAARGDKEGLSVVSMLLDKGADINGRDNQGQTALFHAARHGNTKIVQYLLEKDINYYTTDRDGNIARTVAHNSGHKDIVDAMDNFVTAQTAKRNEEYNEINKALMKRYEDMEKAAKAKPEPATAEDEEAEEETADDADEAEEAAPAVDPAAQAEEARRKRAEAKTAHAEEVAKLNKAIEEKRATPQYEADMRALALESCTFQYWSFVHDSKQTSDLDDDTLDETIDKHKDKVAELTKSTMDAYTLPVKYVQGISTNAKSAIFRELNSMPSKSYRREQGIGKMTDVAKRCKEIAKDWNKSPQPVGRRAADDDAGDATPQDRSALKSGGGKKGGGKKAGGKAADSQSGKATAGGKKGQRKSGSRL